MAQIWIILTQKLSPKFVGTSVQFCTQTLYEKNADLIELQRKQLTGQTSKGEA